MPLIGNYTWSEKKDILKLLVPLKGISPAKVDVLVTSTTLKINYSPYLLEILLQHEVDPLKHKASVKDGTLIVTLYKKVIGLWGNLEIDGDLQVRNDIKKESLANYESLNEELKEKRKDKRLAEEKFSLRKQMALDEAERNRLESIKAEEKAAAEEEVYRTFSEMSRRQSQQPEEKKKISFASNIEETSSPGNHNQTTSDKPSTSKNIFIDKAILDAVDKYLETDDIDFENDQEHLEELLADDHNVDSKSPAINNDIDPTSFKEEMEADIKYIPPPRAFTSNESNGKVPINFTPRVFPTPMRESKAAEEEDWVAKNRRHLKKHGVLGSSLTKGNGVDVSEEDPAWLKAKGDDFFRAGDVRSALNAYCAAIDADGNLTTCYSNRAACYLKLSMPIECKADCSIAIEHINKEIVEENSTTTNKDSQSTGNSKHNLVLVKLLMRRGTANCQLGAFNEALTDFFQAKTKYGFLTGSQAGSLNGVSLESLQADIERLRCLSEADKLKVEADAFFAEKHVDDALLKYSDALKIVPVHVGCLANRSACRFALSDFDGCIEDCSLALALLKHDPSSDRETDRTTKKVQILLGGASSDGGGNTMLQTILPPPGSEKRKLWTIKTLTRRGVAYSQLGMLEKSIADYTSAVKLDSLNEALKADLAKLINCREENQGKEINM